MSEETPKKEPTASEAMFFFAIVKHTRNKQDIDWHAVATEQGFKNAEVAKVRFGQVKRKLGINSDPNASPSAPKTGSTPTKVAKTPSRPRGTKGGRGRSKAKKEASDDEAATPVKSEGTEAGASSSPPPAVKSEEHGEEHFQAE
ncbi:hypothetical protein S7711_06593 [Stachybotrys chartarum IBT 7711]|uniref:Myb-like DNA-binding domain-containing protein n=1 Tax=Stachybotrys chartarum (strain CBS 109288 / IBT 7711) TaxID=1280523 RepID=A0A084AYP7_STACB|nr:hypothetical protein S7711_06593 [Stachybotrys chartarum IBT 7711]KFA50266.1 hypothetical protein S40293_03376 [Stachybotrys chartarum IBT 40293]KFA78324.1 hypothetical protein S40288_05029 [Stachybotrys chartarum IBT 40288]